MYNELFNNDLQKQMTDFFLTELSHLGRVKAFGKNEIVDPEDADNIYIVLDGAFNQVLYSLDGDEINFFRLERGTIFFEMDYFDGYRTCVITKALKNSAVSIISREILEAELMKRPEIYRHFIHSIVRKFRIVMLELADVKFNDSLGKIASALLRLVHTTEYKAHDKTDENYIHMSFTHEELASRLASNRTTITNGLNYFKEKGYIEVKSRKICIKDVEGLKRYINHYWE